MEVREQPCICLAIFRLCKPGRPTIKRLSGFKVVWVFAEEDTDVESLPTLTYAAATGGEELLPQLEAAAQKLSIQLDYEEIAEAGVQGYSEGGRIVIRKSLETPAKAAVILHELSHLCNRAHKAHELLLKRDKQPDAVNKNRQQRKLEAEAIAYVVMRHFGIEYVACHYLATYRIDSTQLKQSLQTISSTAKFLIQLIDPLPPARRVSARSQIRAPLPRSLPSAPAFLIAPVFRRPSQRAFPTIFLAREISVRSASSLEPEEMESRQ